MTRLASVVREAEQAVASAERDVREAPRRGEREHAELAELWRAQGRGEPTDAQREAELSEALLAARAGLECRTTQVLYGEGQTDLVPEWFDPRAEQRLAGSRDALADAEDALRRYCAEHVHDFAAERAPGAADLQARAAAWLTEGHALGAAIQAELTWWTTLARRADRHDLLLDLPDNPLAVLAIAPREVALPMPMSFVG
jgi:hypothetical protein